MKSKFDFYKGLVNNSLVAIRQCKKNLADAQKIGDKNTIVYITERLFDEYNEFLKRTELLLQEIDDLQARLEERGKQWMKID